MIAIEPEISFTKPSTNIVKGWSQTYIQSN
jgi:hypothetical protein